MRVLTFICCFLACSVFAQVDYHDVTVRQGARESYRDRRAREMQQNLELANQFLRMGRPDPAERQAALDEEERRIRIETARQEQLRLQQQADEEAEARADERRRRARREQQEREQERNYEAAMEKVMQMVKEQEALVEKLKAQAAEGNPAAKESP